MVTALDNRPVSSVPDCRPLVAELVGPSGAGKTSLARTLGQQAAVAIATQPDAGNILHAPFFVANTLSLLPMLLDARHRFDLRLTKAEIGTMAIVNGWHQVLRRGIPRCVRLVILDQGPVFMLGQLYRFRSESLARPSLQRWWQRMCARWAGEIDLIVWLDASDADLAHRIRARSQWLSVKDRGDPECYAFVASQRLAYRHLISVLAAHPQPPQLLQFDTSAEPSERTAEHILSACSLSSSCAPDSGLLVRGTVTKPSCWR